VLEYLPTKLGHGKYSSTMELLGKLYFEVSKLVPDFILP
jgi:hypothetical protein